jgi:glycosyltransferase involved in cell wall biosynthesis
LLACEFYHPSVGGVQEVVRQVAERMAARGHDVTVATSSIERRESLELNGVKIVEFDVAGNVVRGISGDIDSYREYVLRGEYDLFMIKAAQQWTLDALLPVLDDLKRPKVLVPCGFSSLLEPAYADYYRQMPGVLAKFDQLIFYASDYRDISMARDHGLTHFSIVPNGASELEFSVSKDPEFRRRHGIDEHAFVVLTVGTFTGNLKGHGELADAFALSSFGDANAVLILNGNVLIPDTPRDLVTGVPDAIAVVRRVGRRLWRLWRSKPMLRIYTRQTIEAAVARINRAGPRKRAMIVDLPRRELVQAYLNSDLFVFASNIEYSPLVLYEAAAAGLPFLTVPVGNASEIAHWTGGGIVCPAPRDDHGYTRVEPSVLAREISRLAEDRTLLVALGQAGREAWARRFTWDKIADRYEAIFVRLGGHTQP